MARDDPTFSDRDVVRIFDRHLTPTEQQDVLAQLAFGLRLGSVDQELLRSLPREAADDVIQGAVVIFILSDVLEGIADAIPVELERDIRNYLDVVRQSEQYADQAVRFLSELRNFEAVLGDTPLEEIRQNLITIRNGLRVTLNVFGNLLAAEDMADDLLDLGHRLESLGTALQNFRPRPL